eukprot:CAMPEP_0176092422 /NCGR_PEP_ID=MMETSP0120_2-20121206/46303_1 /TAXON_ID=160619 /ORGANISM="Kryptoperidinium foliaceum, Strain CCMP 1326" /LENGTH=228 /DNA_ID=CAMNT_0017426339 /DNA_START=30 /DNA_END=713 /DNA_ORIENTATION=+
MVLGASDGRFLVLSLLLTSSICGLSVASAGVVDLTEADFEQRVADGLHSPWLLDFYAPWCGHCRALAPVLEELAARLDGVAHVAKVDCTTAQWLAEQYDVDGFPTLKLVVGGKVYTYSGGRSVDLLEAFAREGYREQEGEALPKDRPWHVRAGKVVLYVFTAHAVPVFGLLAVLCTALACWSTQPTPEDIDRREAFKARLAESERLMEEKRKKGDAGGKKEDEAAVAA